MRIGLSFSRCLRDIFEGKVDKDDVLVIIARTDINPHNDNHWNQIWEGYTTGGLSHPEWAQYKDAYIAFRKMAIELYDDGKLHQPRQYGAQAKRLPYYWLECRIPDEDHTPAQQKAWDNYILITGLSQ